MTRDIKKLRKLFGIFFCQCAGFGQEGNKNVKSIPKNRLENFYQQLIYVPTTSEDFPWEICIPLQSDQVQRVDTASSTLSTSIKFWLVIIITSNIDKKNVEAYHRTGKKRTSWLNFIDVKTFIGFFAKNLKTLVMEKFEQPGQIKNFINQSLCLNYKMSFFSLPKAK